MSIVDDSYTINETYFDGSSYVDWLESFTVDETVDDSRRPLYSKLLNCLWHIPFEPSIGNDDDRAANGIELRKRYYDILTRETGVRVNSYATKELEKIFGSCRVLEMLVGLSMQMYDLMQDLGMYNSVSRWFWEIMSCVGFDAMDDSYWRDGRDDMIVEEVVGHIMHRDGTRSRPDWPGGWFGLDGWQNMEIWYQMHAYLSGYFR